MFTLHLTIHQKWIVILYSLGFIVIRSKLVTYLCTMKSPFSLIINVLGSLPLNVSCYDCRYANVGNSVVFQLCDEFNYTIGGIVLSKQVQDNCDYLNLTTYYTKWVCGAAFNQLTHKMWFKHLQSGLSLYIFNRTLIVFPFCDSLEWMLNKLLVQVYEISVMYHHSQDWRFQLNTKQIWVQG